MATFLAAAAAAAFLFLWGSFWGWIRDQDGPYWPKRTADDPSSKWKEAGVVAIGLPLAAIALMRWGVTIGDEWWRSGPFAAALLAAGTGGAWTIGHLGGMGLSWSRSRTGLSTRMAYVALAASGTLPVAASVAVLAIHGDWLWAAAAILAGAAKVGIYFVAYVQAEVRGDGQLAGPPDATLLGAIGAAALAFATAGAGLAAGGLAAG
ncbi:MAG: hypothetical protein AB7P02_19315 [Alphaproteobacteria bacterium]